MQVLEKGDSGLVQSVSSPRVQGVCEGMSGLHSLGTQRSSR